MSTPDNNRENRLHKVFANVNDWLKLAETKNAMLIAFNGASIYGIAKTLDHGYVENELLLLGFYIALVFLVFSTVVSLCSFIPRVKILTGGRFSATSVRNVHFFEYLKTKSNIDIIKEVTETNNDEYPIYELDLAEQIKQNSIIASRKYEYFTIAVWLTMSAYITFVLAGIIFLYTIKDDLFNKK